MPTARTAVSRPVVFHTACARRVSLAARAPPDHIADREALTRQDLLEVEAVGHVGAIFYRVPGGPQARAVERPQVELGDEFRLLALDSPQQRVIGFNVLRI